MSNDIRISVGGKKIDPVRGGLLFMAVGLAVAGFGVYDYVQQSESIEKAVEVEDAIIKTGVESTSSSSSSGVDYKPQVTFEYKYEGETYTGDSVFPASITQNYDTRSAAASVVEEYDEGGTVTAHVNPDSPNDAFLEDEKSNSPLLFVGIGGLLAVAGGASLLKSFRSGR